MTAYRSIVIVGGGTAGWLAAAYLQRALSVRAGQPLSITLIESEEIGTIGVGEATTPTLRQTLNVIGIAESTLFAMAEATLKNGIRFFGWNRGGDAASDRYDHPFEAPVAMDGYSTIVHWQNLKQRGLTEQAFGDAGVVQTALFDANRSPKFMHSPNYDAPITYGYHLDAQLLATVLKEHAVKEGVSHVKGTVTSVQQDEHGIKSVTLADGAVHTGDLFVDCSGFRSLLIGQALDVPWVPYTDTLLCDRAVAMPVAHATPETPLRTYTTSTAKPSGWTWDIDLQSRRGTGYVYSSQFCSDDEATETLLAHNAGSTALAAPRLLKMRVGHRALAWEKNCLALGLAGGFIEPLESTGIYLVEHALQMFVDYLPPANASGLAANRNRYNTLMSDLYDELRDFIVAHYVLSMRKDTPFWQHYTQGVVLPASLKALLDLWEHKTPTSTDINRRLSMFGPGNWFFILAGLNKLPASGIGQAGYISPERSVQVLAQIAKIRSSAVMQSPTMNDYAQKIRGAMTNAPR